jgi:thiamine kinase-like enzyme
MLGWLQKELGKEWEIRPAGGLTGDAYVAEKNGKRLFLKRNTSPFLAVLSAEGIVPKLVWTKRMENGDVITAQEWLEGRELTHQEMQQEQVAELLHKIHHSIELLHMLMRLGKKPLTSDELFINIKKKLTEINLMHYDEEIGIALKSLDQLLPKTRRQDLVVCHSDLNHNNLILTNDHDLFLVDWDNATIQDPVTDYGMILNWYVPRERWDDWIEKYGPSNSDYLLERMYWYLLHDNLQYLSWHFERNEPAKVQERVRDLHGLNKQIHEFTSRM